MIQILNGSIFGMLRKVMISHFQMINFFEQQRLNERVSPGRRKPFEQSYFSNFRLREGFQPGDCTEEKPAIGGSILMRDGIIANRFHCKYTCSRFFPEFTTGSFINGFVGFPSSAGDFPGLPFPVPDKNIPVIHHSSNHSIFKMLKVDGSGGMKIYLHDFSGMSSELKFKKSSGKC
jgi:hypothetical protein